MKKMKLNYSYYLLSFFLFFTIYLFFFTLKELIKRIKEKERGGGKGPRFAVPMYLLFISIR